MVQWNMRISTLEENARREARAIYRRAWGERNKDKERQYYLKSAVSRAEYARAHRAKERLGSPESRIKWLMKVSKKRARYAGLEFSIKYEDLLPLPKRCPLLGIEISYFESKHRAASNPSLDRIDSGKGYVPGNVHVVSFRANKLKNDASLEELTLIATNLAKLAKERGELS